MKNIRKLFPQSLSTAVIISMLFFTLSADAGNMTSRRFRGCVYAVGFCIGLWDATYDSCAPEVKQSNLSAVDKALQELGTQPDFQSQRFQEVLKATQALPEDQKISAYTQMVGLNPAQENYKRDLVRFLGARDSELSPYIQSTQSNLQISQAAAQQLVQKVMTEIRGNLR